ncbi:MAG: hypothetical protein Q8K77_04455 [Thermodesulfovibrionales bacterium]|nr:hypothetical protein [Thermodesulfovibrionales bacterium]
MLYNPSETTKVEDRYQKLKDILPLTKLIYADNGIVVTEFRYGDMVRDPELLKTYIDIAEKAGEKLDRGKLNIVRDEDGRPALVDW